MTELDLEIPGLAAEIIAEYGKDIGYTRRTPGTYNTETSSAEPVDVPVIIKGIVEPYRGQRLIAGLVEATDLKVTIAAESFAEGAEPSAQDIMEFDDNKYTVINVLPTFSGELIAIYEFQVRR
jgi:hypothetical protein